MGRMVRGALAGGGSGSRLDRVLGILTGVLLAGGTAALAFVLHFNLSTAGSLELLLVVVVALRWGLFEATVVSLTAMGCLNFLFTQPLFQFAVADSQNLISLGTFEMTALLVSGLSSKERAQAANAELQRRRAAKLYELSRAVLLIDGRSSVTSQMAALIREMLEVERVELWVASPGEPAGADAQAETEQARETYRRGVDSDDGQARVACRVLRLGTHAIGGMTMAGWEVDPLLADAVASLAAIAIERARAMQKETRAEAARNTEQLRTAVLDGLAHGFKTPLTAIRTASSGLIELGGMTGTQGELVSIIDEQAEMLNHLSTRLLRTAALESNEVRLRRSSVSMLRVVEEIVERQDEATRERIAVTAAADLRPVEVDAQLVELAIAQLADNAAKYSTGGRKIEIAITQNDSETLVMVANGGSSVRPEERERIFERYYRGQDAARGPSGTGLGLSIVKKTAEAHGGRAWVECVDDVTRFYFTVAELMYRELCNE